MNKKLFLLPAFLFFVLNAASQYYTPAQILNFHTTKTAMEGDMYLDTVNNEYYIGLTSGILARIGDVEDEIIDTVYFQGDTIYIVENTDTATVFLDSISGHDWYKEGTTSSPTNINDTIYTLGELILKSHPATRADDTSAYLNVLYTDPGGQIMSGRREIIPPSPFIDVSIASTGNTIDVYSYYATQFDNAGLGVIPVSNLDFYVLSYDTLVFANVSISTSGILSFDILSTDRSNSCIDVRFYTK